MDAVSVSALNEGWRAAPSAVYARLAFDEHAEMSLSADLIEKVLLLLLTAGLTGLVAPLVVGRINEQRKRTQTVFEAGLARQQRIIDAQVALLEALCRLLWQYQLLLVAVPYWRQFPQRERYPAALAEYEQSSAQLLGQIRAEISKSIRLTPEPMYRELRLFYEEDLLPLDLRLIELASGNKLDSEGWPEFHRLVLVGLAEQIDGLIDRLAGDLGLKAGTAVTSPVK